MLYRLRDQPEGRDLEDRVRDPSARRPNLAPCSLGRSGTSMHQSLYEPGITPIFVYAPRD